MSSRIFSATSPFRRLSKSSLSLKTFDRVIPNQIPRPIYLSGSEQSIIPSDTELQTFQQVNQIRKACQVVRNILSKLPGILLPGITTQKIDDFVFSQCLHHGVYPSPLGYMNFPKSVCTSINSVACHGIPSEDVFLSSGDIISVDISVFNGHAHGDACEAFILADGVSKWKLPSLSQLQRCARLSRDAGISVCKPGVPLGEVGAAIEQTARREGFVVIPNIRGHGIGSYFHGPPDVCHHYSSSLTDCEDRDLLLRPGMVFTVEPCITEGDGEIVLREDGWTVETVDGARCAQFEHTIHVTKTGVEILSC